MNLTIFRPNFRKLVVGVDTKVPLGDGREVTSINLDNAASTPPFVSVLEEINNFSPWYSSIHRGTGYKSKLSSDFYDYSRSIIAEFVGANSNEKNVIYVKNATEGINKLSYRLLEDYGDGVILSTFMEHHSNDLPWRTKYKIDYVQVDNKGRLSLDDLEHKLVKYRGKVKLVTVTGASNVTGYTNPIATIAALAHEYGAKILVDGAQLVPHAPVEIKNSLDPEHLDFLVFSAHKMYAPFGAGVLIGPKDTFAKGVPDYSGGGTIKMVTHDFISWADGSEKDEAGTPNVIGVLALVQAIKILKNIGMDNIERYEQNLTEYALRKLKKIKDIEIYGNCQDSKDRVGIITFNIKGVDHRTLANILSLEAGIAVRNGCFCAQPYVQRLLNVSNKDIEKHMANPHLPHPGMVRISFGLYNTYSEVDKLAQILADVADNKKIFLKKYQDTSEISLAQNIGRWSIADSP
ncbi:MAG: class V aminotransferase [Clostridiaceae bacterium BRH_c20a]|nr:MAG: class V aminotransferase [Clostridiaceae bacterium BRH_c20a]